MYNENSLINLDVLFIVHCLNFEWILIPLFQQDNRLFMEANKFLELFHYDAKSIQWKLSEIFFRIFVKFLEGVQDIAWSSRVFWQSQLFVLRRIIGFSGKNSGCEDVLIFEVIVRELSLDSFVLGLITLFFFSLAVLFFRIQIRQ